MIDDTLRLFNPWWKEDFESPGIERGEYLSELERLLTLQKIVMIHGLRRVGKSTIMKQMIARMIPEYGRENIFYASLDHPQIFPLSIIDLLSEFRKLNKVDHRKKQLLLLDEVHHREGFELELKALNDSEDNLKIVAAGSSSLIIRHKSAAMTGRYMKMEVRPLDFREFLKFTERELDMFEPDMMAGIFEEYLVTGGIPQYVLTRDAQILINILEDIIYKDIVKEYGIKDPGVLKELYFLLMDRVGRPLSYSKLGRLIDMGKDAATRYTNFFQETYLLHLCEKYGTPNERKFANKKVYCPDNGFRVVLTGSAGMGALAENLVFNIIHNDQDVRYYNDGGREIDFIIKDTAFEVKYKDTIVPDDLEGLEMLHHRGITKKVLVTRKGIVPPKGITAIPLWKLAVEGLPK
jgi:uncharacterized protein